MATSFSPTTPVRSIFQPHPNPPKTLLSLPAHGASSLLYSLHTFIPILSPHTHAIKKKKKRLTSFLFTLSAESSYGFKSSWTPAATYATLKLPRGLTLSGRSRPLLSKGLSRRRMGVVRAATIEEIEAEKASIEKDVKNRMERTIENVRSNFNSIRTGRANPAMLDKIEVEYYGSPVSLKTIAQISTPDASSLLVQPYDKSSLKDIEKAIVNSNLGMTPNNDGELIRLSVPQLTSERRKELSKVVAKQAEEGKVALRNIRRDALKAYEKLEKEKKLSEDNVKDLTSDLQKLTDDYIKKVDTIFKQKEKELLTV